MEDSLSADVVSKGLETRFVGQRVLYYPSVASTMDIARQEARQGAMEGTVIVADEQTAGRGRLQRLWLSPKGSISLSTIFYPDLSYLSSLIMLASLAVVHSVETVTGLRPQIKWPNDVLIDGRKVCGILVESDVRGNKVNYAIIGIGINVNIKLDNFPEIQPIATSLSDELGREVSRLSVVHSLLVEMEKLYLAPKAGEYIYQEWRDSLITLGRRVRVTTDETTCEGVAESVATDGSLLLRDSDGGLTKIVAGDVTLRH